MSVETVKENSRKFYRVQVPYLEADWYKIIEMYLHITSSIAALTLLALRPANNAKYNNLFPTYRRSLISRKEKSIAYQNRHLQEQGVGNSPKNGQ